jgi:hypothetical protein
MYVLHDRALVGHARPRLDSCPTPSMGGDIGPLLRKATSGHSWIAKWSSWLLGTQIQVSPMSGTWLRAHEADWSKHDMDV